MRISDFGPKQVVLTGVYFNPLELGAASYDRNTGNFCYAFSPRIPGLYHGTGDLFGSVLLSGILRGLSLGEAMELAVYFTHNCIELTQEMGIDHRYGVCFEPCLPNLIRRLHLS